MRLLAGALLVALVSVSALVAPAPAQANGPNRAGLVVRFGDGDLFSTCVEFNEPEISGIDLLNRAGLSVILQDGGPFGSAVCKIGRDGCDFPLDDCFCKCVGADCTYWAYYHMRGDGSWEYSAAGASGYKVRNGAVEGWSWGPGDFGSSGTQPPVVPFDMVCAVQQPPTNTPVPPTPTPQPTQTPTRTPTRTVTPTPTVAPANIEFWTERAEVVAGQCTNLGWRISNAVAVYLNGQGVTGEEVRSICPTNDTTYALRVVSAAGETTRELSVRVLPATATPTPAATATSKPGATRQPTATFTRTPTRVDAAAPTADANAPATPTPEPTSTPAAIAALNAPPAPPAAGDTAQSSVEGLAQEPPAAPTALARVQAQTPQVWSRAVTAQPAARPLAPTPAPAEALHAAASPLGDGARLFFNYALFFLMAALLAGVGVWAMRRQTA